MGVVIGLLLSYLLGSIPSAFVLGRVLRGVDLRSHGSGNLGATNAFRVLGPGIATVVMIMDTAKGALPVLLLPAWFGASPPELWAIVFGVAAIVGHVRPVFLLGKGGGKGVATATGVFLALAWLPTLLAFAAWTLVLWRTGYVSLASLVAAVAMTIGILFFHGISSPIFLAGLAVSIFVIWSHRANISRLRAGSESRFRRNLRGAKLGLPTELAPKGKAPTDPSAREVRR